MTELQLFLSENPVENITKEIKLNGRLKDFTFVIKPMSIEEFNRYQKLCIKVNGKKREFDLKRYNELLVINHTLTPNFKDVEWLNNSKVATPEALINKVLKAGEISDLAEEILELSGFDNDVDEMEDEIKN